MEKNGEHIRVAVFDSKAGTLSSLAGFINSSPRFTCVGAFENTDGILKKIISANPQVVIFGTSISFDGIRDAVMKIKNHFASIKIMVQFDPCEEGDKKLTHVIALGADGYLVHTAPDEQISEAILRVHEFGSYLCPQIAGTVLLLLRNRNPDARNEKDVLTPREHDVLKLLVKGKTYKKIGVMLNLSRSTINTHIEHIYEKMQVHSKSEAVVKALEEHMV